MSSEPMNISATSSRFYHRYENSITSNMKLKQILTEFIHQELREIFENAPQNPAEAASTGNTKGVRKEIDGDCPICFMPLEAENESIVWCKAACGNNVHQACFQQWVSSQRGKEIRCVYWYDAAHILPYYAIFCIHSNCFISVELLGKRTMFLLWKTC